MITDSKVDILESGHNFGLIALSWGANFVSTSRISVQRSSFKVHASALLCSLRSVNLTLSIVKLDFLFPMKSYFGACRRYFLTV